MAIKSLHTDIRVFGRKNGPLHTLAEAGERKKMNGCRRHQSIHHHAHREKKAECAMSNTAAKEAT